MSRAEQVHEWLAATWNPDLTLAEWWDALFEAGLAFPSWPEGLGGYGATNAEARAVTAALAAANVIGPPAGNGPAMGGPTVIRHGTPEQQQRFVAPMARGLHQWCQLFSEPGAGSDLSSLATRAERDGDEYVITGQKVWNSKADMSEWGMLLARTDVDLPKHQGITFIMLDMQQPGVEVRPLRQMNGAAEFCEVFFTEARAKVADVIGSPNDGWNVARTTLLHERASTAAGKGRGLVTVPAGGMEGQLARRVGELVDESRRRANDPERRGEILLNSRSMVQLARDFGRTAEPVMRQRLMRYHTHSEVYRLNGRRAADLARVKQAGPDGSMMKLDLAMLAHESRDLSLWITGAEGMLLGDDAREGGRIQRAALSSHIPSLGGGTNEIQRNIIAERTLGLPREPGTDTEVPFRELRRS